MRGILFKKGLSSVIAKNKVIVEQKKRSPRCLEYYKAKGYSDVDAIIARKDFQSKNAKLSPFCLDYYKNKGYTDSESLKMRYDYCRKLSLTANREKQSHSLKDFWNSEKGLLAKEKLTFNMCGSKNPMYGRVPGKSAGSGISGYYKNFLFRSLMELDAILYFEDVGLNFTTNELKDYSEPLFIYSDLKIKRYIPDLLILDNNNNILNMVEVKPKDNLDKIPNIDNLLVYSIEYYNLKLYESLYTLGKLEIHENKLERFIKFVSEAV